MPQLYLRPDMPRIYVTELNLIYTVPSFDGLTTVSRDYMFNMICLALPQLQPRAYTGNDRMDRRIVREKLTDELCNELSTRLRASYTDQTANFWSTNAHPGNLVHTTCIFIRECMPPLTKDELRNYARKVLS